MTRDKWAALSAEEHRIKVAELCGIVSIHKPGKEDEAVCKYLGCDLLGRWKDGGFATVPNYLNDLNAMHEAEKVMKYYQRWEWEENLNKIVNGCPHDSMQATAAQRAEAFAMTMETENGE